MAKSPGKTSMRGLCWLIAKSRQINGLQCLTAARAPHETIGLFKRVSNRPALNALNTSGADQPGTAAIVPNQQDDGSKG